MSSYRARRKQIMDAIDEVGCTARELKAESVERVLQVTKEGLADDVFRIVVVGEFSRGKSTFVNGLLGRRVLPSSANPTTTVLSKIVYAEQQYYRLHYRDGRDIMSVTEAEFQSIVAPEEPDPDDLLMLQQRDHALQEYGAVSYAEIGYPAALCQGGVELIDTPGTNDLDAAREEITYKFIPEADAAIFVLSTRPPLTETELDFFKDRILKADIQKIFFVVNFKDRLATSEGQEKVMNRIVNLLTPVVKDLRIYLISAKQALDARRAASGEAVAGTIVPLSDSGYPELEAAVGLFLTEERGRVKLAKPLERTLRMASELKQNAIRLPLSMLGIHLSELEKKALKIQGELDRVTRVASDAIQRLSVALNAGGLGIRVRWESGLHEVATAAVQTVTNYTGPLQQEEIARAIESAVAPIQTSLQERIHAAQAAVLEEETGRSNRRLEQEWEAIQQMILHTFIMDPGKSMEESAGFGKLYDQDEVIVKTGIGSLGMLGAIIGLHVALPLALPALFFGGSFMYSYFDNKVRDNALAKIRVQVERRYRDVIPAMCADLDKQWQKTIEDTIRHFEQETGRKLKAVADQLQQAIRERNTEAGSVEQQRTYLLKLETRLDHVISNLDAMSGELGIGRSGYSESAGSR
ncbi:dynamin family protein [Paenibacillus sp. MMS20-IR301]|uniref:dynamin family protein n=1 Tax=Paenibacillus sp. MMS20-IR301 TaxID=2895946 RepID=UPI0028E21CEC|nr:dynamin family protein [Paenibacillus sp. MMS20-IR301]WNS46312.1 dynamin family protein [Paenibacillus sp. MMS20-IR301]